MQPFRRIKIFLFLLPLTPSLPHYFFFTFSAPVCLPAKQHVIICRPNTVMFAMVTMIFSRKTGKWSARTKYAISIVRCLQTPVRLAYESCIPWTPRVCFFPEVQLTIHKMVSNRSKFLETSLFLYSGTRQSEHSLLNTEMKLLRSLCDSPELLTYLLTPWCRVLLEKLTGLQLVKKLPAFHGTRRFITALTSVRQLSLSWASPIQSIYPNPTSWRSILIFTHLRLGLPSSSFPPVSPPRPYTPPLLIHTRHVPSPSHSSRFYHPHNIGWGVQTINSSLCNLLHSPVTSSLLGPNILLNTIFSNTLSFLSSRNVSDQVSHPYKTTGKIIVLYILIFKLHLAK